MDSAKHNYLTNVILKFDFKSDIVIPDGLIGEIENSISSEFIYEQTEKTDLKVNLDSDQLLTESKKTKMHTFKNSSEDTIILESNSLSFTIKNYRSYKEFITIIKKVTLLLQEYDLELKRLGLRYINHIKLMEGNPFEWDGYITAELTNSMRFINEPQYLSRNLGQITFKKPDYFLTFLYGWSNSEFPNPIAKREFVLDYDCFTENSLKLSEAFTIVERFHTEIKKMFVKSIGDKLRTEIGEDDLCLI